MLDDNEMKELQRIAKRNRMTVAEWVRRAIRASRGREPVASAGKKLDIVRFASRHSYPTGDIEKMLAEIESGYLTGC